MYYLYRSLPCNWIYKQEKRRQIIVENNNYNHNCGMVGLRRLLYNPYSPNLERVIEKDVRTKPTDLRKLS